MAGDPADADTGVAGCQTDTMNACPTTPTSTDNLDAVSLLALNTKLSLGRDKTAGSEIASARNNRDNPCSGTYKCNTAYCGNQPRASPLVDLAAFEGFHISQRQIGNLENGGPQLDRARYCAEASKSTDRQVQAAMLCERVSQYKTGLLKNEGGGRGILGGVFSGTFNRQEICNSCRCQMLGGAQAPVHQQQPLANHQVQEPVIQPPVVQQAVQETPMYPRLTEFLRKVWAECVEDKFQADQNAFEKMAVACVPNTVYGLYKGRSIKGPEFTEEQMATITPQFVERARREAEEAGVNFLFKSNWCEFYPKKEQGNEVGAIVQRAYLNFPTWEKALSCAPKLFQLFPTYPISYFKLSPGPEDYSERLDNSVMYLGRTSEEQENAMADRIHELCADEFGVEGPPLIMREHVGVGFADEPPQQRKELSFGERYSDMAGHVIHVSCEDEGCTFEQFKNHFATYMQQHYRIDPETPWRFPREPDERNEDQ